MERPAAIALLHQHVYGDALIKHCLATGAVMKAVAGFFSQDPVRWEEIGILHDIDFEYVNGGHAAAWDYRCEIAENRRHYGLYM